MDGMVLTGRQRPADRLGGTSTQDTLEMRGVVRVRQLARSRQMQVVQTGQPEAQRRGAQQRRPCFALVGIERAQRVVSLYEGICERGLERAPVRLDTPIVDRDGEVVGEEIGCGETEVDQAGDAHTLEQDVVAE